MASNVLRNHLNTEKDQCYNQNARLDFYRIITCSKTIKNVYSELIETKLLKFLLTYKFNQEHLELLFGAIRSKRSFKFNPTVAQFEAAYKSIIINEKVKCPSTANALALDNTSIL